MLSIGLDLYIQVFTISVKSDSIYKKKTFFTISAVLYKKFCLQSACGCVCVFCFEALMYFQKALIPDSNRLDVFRTFHHNNY